MCEKFFIKKENIEQSRALLALCSNKPSDIVAISYISRELEKHYCPEHFANISIVLYSDIEEIFNE